MLPADWLRRFRGGWELERPLAPRTTWRIGGPAELYIEPASTEELLAALERLRRSGVAWRLLGGGSNLLVADRGVRGAVLCLARLAALHREGTTVVAEAGVRLSTLVRFAIREGLQGAEKLAGIPGCIGGAVFGNAGGRHGDIGGLVRFLDLLEPDGRLVRLAPPPGFFRYRHSDVRGRIVVRAELELREADPREVCARTFAIIRERRKTQPGWVGNAGCVFKNPPGHGAGRLIDTAGCKGMREGGVTVSEIHANFFENEGRATCADVERLVERVRDAVRRAHGVEMELEVRRWE
ncbi:MAG: UDP-N-acetylmuramate dehydrogenase [Planctomycetota bacterium]